MGKLLYSQNASLLPEVQLGSGERSKKLDKFFFKFSNSLLREWDVGKETCHGIESVFFLLLIASRNKKLG